MAGEVPLVHDRSQRPLQYERRISTCIEDRAFDASGKGVVQHGEANAQGRKHCLREAEAPMAGRGEPIREVVPSLSAQLDLDRVLFRSLMLLNNVTRPVLQSVHQMRARADYPRSPLGTVPARYGRHNQAPPTD